VDYLRANDFWSQNVYEGILSCAKPRLPYAGVGAFPVRSPRAPVPRMHGNKPPRLSAEAHFGQRRFAVTKVRTPHVKPLREEQSDELAIGEKVTAP
jgi:hypothetical protein